MKRYKVCGNVSSVSHDGEIMVRDLYNDEQPPVMLKTGKKILEYLTALGNGDEEEKYMRKRFTYCSICYVRKIEVLDKSGKVVKVVVDDILGE